MMDQTKFYELVDQVGMKRILTELNNEKSEDDAIKFVHEWNKTPGKLNTDYFKNASRYLMGKHIDKNGYLRRFTPFKTVEQIYVLSTLKEIWIVSIEDVGTPFKKFWLPKFRAIGDQDRYFDYYLFKGNIEILNND